jgi:glycosyltransferase involved in cell wall biosynthesis
MTSYNHAKYLRESIDSVLNQTFQDFEFIIVDDASTDESWDIVQSYTDPRIRPYRNESNQSVIYGLNMAIFEKAAGDYLAFQISDDRWEPTKLEKQVAYLDEHPELGAVFTNLTPIGEWGEPFTDQSRFNFKIFDQPQRSRYEWLNFFFKYGNALCHSSAVVRKNCYQECGPYKKGLIQLQDFDMWIRLCLKFEIYVMPEKLMFYRVRENMANASSPKLENRIRSSFELLQILDNYCSLSSFEEIVKVFPSAQKYYSPQGCDSEFVLALIALEIKPHTFTALFALNLLFRALNDPFRAKKIKELYDFDNVKFKELTGKHDVFSLRTSIELTEKEQALRDLNTRLQVFEVIFNSKAWRLTRALRKFLHRFILRGGP